MNEIMFNEQNFQSFLNENKGNGYLNIRAYAANLALPVSGVKIKVSKVIDNLRVIFYEGTTDESGVISSIILPTPIIDSSDEVVPKSITYDIEANYNNQVLNYVVSMFSNISVLQNINVIPSIRLEGSIYGS